MNEISSQYDNLRKFENNFNILKFTLEYGNIPMWPLIRNQVIIYGINSKYGSTNKKREKAFCREKSVLKELTFRNPYLTTHKDVAFVGFPSSNFEKHENGILYDERIKAYVDLFHKSSMIISVTDNDEFVYGYKNWKSDYAVNEFATNEKWKNRSKKDALVLKQFVKFLEDECPVEISTELKKKIYQILMFYSKYLRGYVEAWKIYLKVVRPKLVVEYCGCFMGISNVAMNLACDKLKISTAEIQVSSIRKNFHSYCCGRAIAESDICKHIYPDYFLTWGKYWGNIVNNPCRTVTIGTHRKYETINQRNENVLICLSGMYESYIKYIDLIMSYSTPKSKIYLRIHPKENSKNVRNIFKKFEEDNRFNFANQSGLQDYLKECTYMFACGSTVIYEALACGKIVFIPKDYAYDLHSMDGVKDKINSFETPEEFSILWQKRFSMQMKAYNDFFEMNYEKLFKKFVRDITEKRIK